MNAVSSTRALKPSTWKADMNTTTLDGVLRCPYPFNVLTDPAGGYIVVLPDRPGCMTQAETLAEIPAVVVVEEDRQLWIETAFEDGEEIRPPFHTRGYRGKFLVRVPRTLHQRLAASAEREGVSLNQYVVALLSERNGLGEFRQVVAPNPSASASVAGFGQGSGE